MNRTHGLVKHLRGSLFIEVVYSSVFAGGSVRYHSSQDSRGMLPVSLLEVARSTVNRAADRRLRGRALY